ncbi:MAG: CpaD family pilus assembly protein [Alphaproteobacteria bacterium]|nr:CpaD family pilus assembly protein [Alphaproteobacteria bacterium]MBU0794873.1 CpaD family pilus assembly protein [Alphaproteobacteria bacterium]MBU0875502.1 CpaD family pilus assembly protein [Alphaproteobacteria bacterium]MBU1771371.1 CpaD family pilus assembly protein [Alphaproteobacteria bacterium]
MINTGFFRSTGTAALVALSLLSHAGAAAEARKTNRGLEPVHQPVVDRTDFVFDLQSDGAGALSSADERRLTVWLDALGLRYGDHVTIAGAGESPLALRDGIAQVVGRFGLLVEGEAPVTAGEAPAGGVRVVVSRSIASVPGCPTWRDKAEANFIGGLSDNYGCATASNLAAMVADPRDLVEGREGGLDVTNVVNSKAIKTYQETAPTGAGGLQGMAVGGN